MCHPPRPRRDGRDLPRGRGAYGGQSFPPGPASFEPDPALPGRSTFHVFVGVGKSAPAELRREAFEILNTLRFDPEVQPDWQSAG